MANISNHKTIPQEDEDTSLYDITENQMSKYNNWISAKLDAFPQIAMWEIPPLTDNLLRIFIHETQISSPLEKKIRKALSFEPSNVQIITFAGELSVGFELQ